MKQYYNILDALKEELQNNPSTNTVHEGDFFKVDLSKETVFPLANIDTTEVEFLNHYNRFTIQIVVADIVDDVFPNEKDEINVFHGADNLQDIYNTQLSVLNLVQSSLRRGSLNDVDFVLQDDESSVATPFEQRFENLLAGWVLNVVIDVPNDNISVCQR